MSGENEATTVVDVFEAMAAPTIPEQGIPPQVVQQPAAAPPVMIDDNAGLIICGRGLIGLGHRRRDLAQRSTQSYAIIWDQCSPTMRGKLEQLELANCDAINMAKKPVPLLEEIRNMICGREAHKKLTYPMVQLVKIMCCLVQNCDGTNQDYKEAFESLWDTLDLEQQGGAGASPRAEKRAREPNRRSKRARQQPQ